MIAPRRQARNFGKDAERRIAARIGGERVPAPGREMGHKPDIAHDWLSVEVKARTAFPTWLARAMQQAVASVRGEQLPVVFLHTKGQRYDHDLIVLRAKDAELWFGLGKGALLDDDDSTL